MNIIRFISHLLILCLLFNPLGVSFAGGPGSDEADASVPGHVVVAVPGDGTPSEGGNSAAGIRPGEPLPASHLGAEASEVESAGATARAAAPRDPLEHAIDLYIHFQDITRTGKLKTSLADFGIRLPWAKDPIKVRREAIRKAFTQKTSTGQLPDLSRITKVLEFVNILVIQEQHKALHATVSKGPIAGKISQLGLERPTPAISAESITDPDLKIAYDKVMQDRKLAMDSKHQAYGELRVGMNITAIVLASIIVLYGFIGSLACYYNYCGSGSHSGPQPDFVPTLETSCTEVVTGPVDDPVDTQVCSQYWTTAPTVCVLDSDPTQWGPYGIGYNTWAAKNIVGYGVAGLGGVGLPFWIASIALAIQAAHQTPVDREAQKMAKELSLHIDAVD